MRGIKLNGMLMAASDASHETVELLVPPEGSVPGERIWFGAEEEKGKQPDAATPNQVLLSKFQLLFSFYNNAHSFHDCFFPSLDIVASFARA